MSETKNILLLAIHQEMGEGFLSDVCDQSSSGSGSLALNGLDLKLNVLAGDPRLNPSWDETVRTADAMILLNRFLDVISLDKIKAIYRRLPSDKMIPLSVVLVREEGENDFKMSCPACGQKLWVRDSDIGKRGRCPTCKKPFKLPSQAEMVRSQLMLPDTVYISTVARNDKESCLTALSDLSGSLAGSVSSSSVQEENLKKTTVRVQINSEED